MFKLLVLADILVGLDMSKNKLYLTTILISLTCPQGVLIVLHEFKYFCESGTIIGQNHYQTFDNLS